MMIGKNQGLDVWFQAISLVGSWSPTIVQLFFYVSDLPTSIAISLLISCISRNTKEGTTLELSVYKD